VCRAAANAEMMHWSDALVLTLAGRIQNYEILLCSSQTCFSRGSAALRNERGITGQWSINLNYEIFFIDTLNFPTLNFSHLCIAIFRLAELICFYSVQIISPFKMGTTLIIYFFSLARRKLSM
jgi:hypothetical protein